MATATGSFYTLCGLPGAGARFRRSSAPLAPDLVEMRPQSAAYRAVLLEEPYEEHLHIAVMELTARQGRRDLVRRQYVRLQDLLKELDVEPLEETQSSYHRLMR